MNQNKFDKIYVLSMERSQNRHERIEEIFKGVDFDYFFGMDAKKTFSNIDYIAEIDKSFFSDNGVDYEYVKRWNLGQLGGYYSWKLLIEKLYNENHEVVVVFEDDIVPCKSNFIDLINSALSVLPPKWEVLQLGYEYDGRLYKKSYSRFFRPIVRCVNFILHVFNRKNKYKIPRKYNTLLDYSGTSLGAHALCLSRKGIEKLKKEMHPLREGSDQLINKLINESKIDAYSIYPQLFMQLDKADSDTR